MKHVFLCLPASFEGLEWLRKVEYTVFMLFAVFYLFSTHFPFFYLQLQCYRKFWTFWCNRYTR